MSALLRTLLGSRVEVAEEAPGRRAASPILPLPHQLARPQPLRMAAHHEGLGDQHAGAVARREAARPPRRVSAIGFSHSTCLPASRRRERSAARAGDWAADCRSPRSRGRRAAPRTSRRPSGMPSAAARRFCAVARSREAIAAMRQCLLACIAGMTFSRAILAVPNTAKRTGSMLSSEQICDQPITGISLGARLVSSRAPLSVISTFSSMHDHTSAGLYSMPGSMVRTMPGSIMVPFLRHMDVGRSRMPRPWPAARHCCRPNRPPR